MRKLGVVFVALAIGGSAAAAPSPASFRGIVVGAQKGALLVASTSGAVRAIPGHARIGARISLVGGKLTVVGRAHRALVRGVVVRRHGNLTFLSASQHMLVLHRAAVRTVSSARDNQPAPGSVVQATVSIDDQGELDEENESQVGQQQEAEVQGTITAVGTGTVTLSVNGQPLTIPLPAGLTLPTSIVGTQVTLKLEFSGGNATVSPGANDDDQGENDDDNGPVTTTTTSMTTTSMTTTTPFFHDDGGDHHGGDGHHGGGGD
jgi:hypothetical protein